MKRTAWLWLVLSAPVTADGFLETRCSSPFPEAMQVLQEAIAAQGYTLSRVQHVDRGLRQRGYETGDYRVVFFGRPEQMRQIRTQHPELMPYLPLSITLFEQTGYTGASSLDPLTLGTLFDDPELDTLFAVWHADIQVMIDTLSRCDADG